MRIKFTVVPNYYASYITPTYLYISYYEVTRGPATGSRIEDFSEPEPASKCLDAEDRIRLSLSRTRTTGTASKVLLQCSHAPDVYNFTIKSHPGINDPGKGTGLHVV